MYGKKSLPKEVMSQFCEDLHHGRPRYVERNKVDGAPFKHEHGIIPAEIVYCQVIESWVFRHDDIRTSNTEDEVTAS